MARTFAATDEWRGAIGNCNFAGASTIAAIIRVTTDGQYRRLGPMLYSSGGAQHLALNRDNANRLWVHYQGASDVTSTITVTAADGWCLIAVAKATGTVSPSFYKIPLASLSVTSHTPAGTSADHSAPGSSGTVRIGANSDDFVGDWHMGAIWDRALTQAELERLAVSLQAWYFAAPRGGWLFDQDAVAQKVADFTGGGANESSLTGTSVASASVPGFTYGFPIMDVGAVIAALLSDPFPYVGAGYYPVG